MANTSYLAAICSSDQAGYISAQLFSSCNGIEGNWSQFLIIMFSENKGALKSSQIANLQKTIIYYNCASSKTNIDHLFLNTLKIKVSHLLEFPHYI